MTRSWPVFTSVRSVTSVKSYHSIWFEWITFFCKSALKVKLGEDGMCECNINLVELGGGDWCIERGYRQASVHAAISLAHNREVFVFFKFVGFACSRQWRVHLLCTHTVCCCETTAGWMNSRMISGQRMVSISSSSLVFSAWFSLRASASVSKRSLDAVLVKYAGDAVSKLHRAVAKRIFAINEMFTD